MDPLAVLLRLARQRLDDERRALLAVNQAIDATRDQLLVLRQAAELERRNACELPDRDLRLATYQRRVHTQERALEAELRRLESARAAQAERLAASRLELRRLDILTERRTTRMRAVRERREQKTIDELALVRRRAGTGS